MACWIMFIAYREKRYVSAVTNAAIWIFWRPYASPVARGDYRGHAVCVSNFSFIVLAFFPPRSVIRCA